MSPLFKIIFDPPSINSKELPFGIGAKEINSVSLLEFSIATGGWVYTSPSAVDIDTGVAIFFGSDDGLIYAVDTDGTSLMGWPINTGSKVVGSIAFADVDGDLEPEVVSSNEDGYVLVYHLELIDLSLQKKYYFLKHLLNLFHFLVSNFLTKI